jgi:phosphohistidine phosphatase
MKTVYFIRHGKASRDDWSLDDFDRPLTERGLNDLALVAPKIAESLNQLSIKKPLILGSSALRTKTTAETLASLLSLHKMVFEKDLYLSMSATIIKHINNLSEEFDCVLLVAHNPGISDAVEYNCGEYFTMPTSGTALVTFPKAETWGEIGRDTGDLQHFWYPKQFKI